jgi:hypothetical protein
MPGLRLIVLLTAILVLDCTGRQEEITGINWDIWKDDRNGCQRQRLAYLQPISTQKDKLKARSEMDIVDLMGRPDQTELYKRNQKFYTYYVVDGPGCASADSTGKKLVIRFNAMGLAKEISVE